MALMVCMGVAAWFGVAWAGRQCVRTWRAGADQLWDARWKSACVTFAVAAFAVMCTAALLPGTMERAALLVSAGLWLAFFVASGASAIARRRHTAHARALREQLGLPVERHMLHPGLVFAWWAAAAVVALCAWAVVTAASPPTTVATSDNSGPAVDGMHPYVSGGLMLLLGLGGAHAFYQEHRRSQEQRRLRAVDLQYIRSDHNGTG
ncbi:hypothetical protein [Streptomyces sp. SGAir0957]